MSNDNWLMEEAKKAKESTSDWPQWRKESITSSKTYGYADKSNLSCSSEAKGKSHQNTSKK